MKKQSVLQRFKQLPKRTRNLVLAGVGGMLLICCCLPLAFSGNTKEGTRTAGIQISSVPTEASLTSVTETSVPTNTIIAPTATFTPALTITNAPTETPASIPTQPPQAKLNACLPENAKIENGKVIRVVDGDTIEVDVAGNQFTVRYIGIDTPETKDPNAPVQFYGPEATQRNTELVAGKDVALVKDVSETDRYNRLLRYVFVGNVFINETLVKEGYAFAKAYPPDTACNSVFMAAQVEAKSGTLGVWSAPVKSVELATQTPVAGSGGCPQGCLEQQPGCDIKGNINSTGEKIYHVPGSSSYSRTKIDPSNGERWFCNADEAVANGWRAPRN